jgi:4-aminobutyrate--pyruvate transaminase
VADKTSKRVFDAKLGVAARCAQFAQEVGLIVRGLADSVAICPPLVITPAEIDVMFDRLATALNRTLDWATREKLLDA